MLIPKSYLTTPPVPDWFRKAAAKDYEKLMSDHLDNDHLKQTVFSKPERDLIEASKKLITEAVDPFLLNHVGIVIAGGCWASAIQGEAIKDIDIFILEKWHTAFTIQSITKLFPTIQKRDGERYRSINPNVREVWTTPDKKIQIIFTKHETRKQLIEDFDYLHCRTSYWGDKLYITREVFDAIIKKQLILKNEKNFQEWRRDKFLERGYKLPIWEVNTLHGNSMFTGPIKAMQQHGYFTTQYQTQPVVADMDLSDKEFFDSLMAGL
jgi:hypothetical protein